MAIVVIASSYGEDWGVSIGIVFGSLVTTACIMIFIEISEKIYMIRKNSDEILKVMKQK